MDQNAGAIGTVVEMNDSRQPWYMNGGQRNPVSIFLRKVWKRFNFLLFFFIYAFYTLGKGIFANRHENFDYESDYDRELYH